MHFWNRSEYWIRRGNAARAARSWNAAAGSHRKALKYQPELAPIWVQYGHALKESGNLGGAETAYRGIEELDAEPGWILVRDRCSVALIRRLISRQNADDLPHVTEFRLLLTSNMTCDPAVHRVEPAHAQCHECQRS